MKWLILCFLLVNTAQADDKGLEIAKKIYNRDSGISQVAHYEMKLIDKNGSTQKRSMYSYGLEKKKGEAKVLFRFLEPADIKDTGLLTIDHLNKDSEQWLYLPALKRNRRISSSRKGGSFVGSDFSYEDLQSRKVDKDEHKYLGKKNWKGKDYDVVESTPKDKSSSVYSKRVIWVDMKALLPVRVLFYKKKEKPVKMLETYDIKKIDGIWTSMGGEMTDMQSKHKTELRISKVKYNIALPESLFSQKTLQDPTQELRYRKL